MESNITSYDYYPYEYYQYNSYNNDGNNYNNGIIYSTRDYGYVGNFYDRNLNSRKINNGIFLQDKSYSTYNNSYNIYFPKGQSSCIKSYYNNLINHSKQFSSENSNLNLNMKLNNSQIHRMTNYNYNSPNSQKYSFNYNNGSGSEYNNNIYSKPELLKKGNYYFSPKFMNTNSSKSINVIRYNSNPNNLNHISVCQNSNTKCKYCNHIDTLDLINPLNSTDRKNIFNNLSGDNNLMHFVTPYQKSKIKLIKTSIKKNIHKYPTSPALKTLNNVNNVYNIYNYGFNSNYDCDIDFEGKINKNMNEYENNRTINYNDNDNNYNEFNANLNLNSINNKKIYINNNKVI